jgi:hypothetical protein
VGTVCFLKDLARRWVRRSEELRELSIAQGGIAIGVDSANDGEQLALSGIVATASQEGTKVEGADATIVVLVNRAVRSVSREVISTLQIALEDVKSALKADFLLEDVQQGLLDVEWEAVVAANISGRSVKSDIAQQIVFTRQKELEEPKKGGLASTNYLIWPNKF